MLTSCLQEQASKDVVACQVAWPPAGPLDNRTATTGAANRHLFGFDRNRVRFEPESLFAITGMRNTMATRLAEDGASASEIQHILGHESLNTSQTYIDATANEQRAAVRANRTYRALGKIAKNM
jgi:integrase